MSDGEKILNFPDPNAIEGEAAAWLVRLDNEPSASCYAEFQEWQKRSPLHRETFAQFAPIWSDYDLLQKLAPPIRDVGDLDDGGFPIQKTTIPWSRITAIAASIVVMLGAGFWYATNHLQPARISVAAPDQAVQLQYETAMGMLKTVTLPDGSQVSLNTDSRIAVKFAEGRRTVYLEKGEAFFNVVHNARRPFTVEAGKRVVRDIGTAFDVRVLDNAVEVSVAKGSVQLAARTSGISDAREQNLGIFDAGHNVVFDREIERADLISEKEMSRKLSWRSGSLDYKGEPLSKALSDISRYTGIIIDVRDPSLNNLPIGGHFEINRINDMFVAFRVNFGIRVKWLDPKHVELYPARQGVAKAQPAAKEKASPQ